jgi:hypothetical protein
MRLEKDSKYHSRGTFRIRHDDGSLSELMRLGEARQVIRQHVEDELRRRHYEIEAARKPVRERTSSQPERVGA